MKANHVVMVTRRLRGWAPGASPGDRCGLWSLCHCCCFNLWIPMVSGTPSHQPNLSDLQHLRQVTLPDLCRCSTHYQVQDMVSTLLRKENSSLRSGKEHPMRLGWRKSLCRQWWRLAGCNHLLWMPARCCWHTRGNTTVNILLTPHCCRPLLGISGLQWERKKEFWAAKELICLPNYVLMSLWPSTVPQNYPKQTRLCTRVEHWH